MKLTRSDIEIAMTTLVNPSGAWRMRTVFAHIVRASEFAHELKSFLEKHEGDNFEITSVVKTLEGREKPENDHMAIMQLAGAVAELTPFQYAEFRIMLLAQPKLGDFQELMKT